MAIWKKINSVNPKVVILITAIAVLWVNLNIGSWRNRGVIQHDVAFYYAYLPSAFIYHDLSLDFLKDPRNEFVKECFYFPPKTENGDHVFKPTYGMALSYLPFYLLAHGYSKLTDEPIDGFSSPFQLAIQTSSLVYFLFGLIFLIRILRRFFSNSVTILSLLIITFGTNVFYYLTMGAGMSHAIDFALSCSFIYYTIKWHTEQSYYTSFRLGLIGALITLIRPINILVYVFFFLYGMTNREETRNKLRLLQMKYVHLFIMAACGFLLFLPQLIYWKLQTGHWFYNSYVGEHFYFNNPHILEGLFSFRKGWLIYTPTMLIAIGGIFFLLKSKKEFYYSTLALLILYVYVAFSWWCWWYGGSFGQRSMIDLYPFLTIPLAAFLAYISNRTDWISRTTSVVVILLVCLNLFQTMQAKYNIIHYDSMTKAAYIDAFFRTEKHPEREKLLQHPNLEKAMRGEDEY